MVYHLYRSPPQEPGGLRKPVWTSRAVNSFRAIFSPNLDKELVRDAVSEQPFGFKTGFGGIETGLGRITAGLVGVTAGLVGDTAGFGAGETGFEGKESILFDICKLLKAGLLSTGSSSLESFRAGLEETKPPKQFIYQQKKTTIN